MRLLLCSFFLLTTVLTSSVSGESCPTNGSCPILPHDIDLSPLQGTWDTLHYGHAVGSTVSNIPHFFNISLCGSIRGGSCSNSSVCYSGSLETFYNLGNTSSCQYHYQDRQVTFTFRFSSESSVKRKYGSGNVSVTLICGRTLGVPEVVSGDPYADEIVILWETSAACKNSSSLRYTSESKCYHIHTYDDNGLRANFIDLTSLIRPRGYKVIYSQDKRYKFLFSVCKPLAFSASDSDHPAQCNGHMACLVAAPGSSVGGVALPLVIGSGTSRRDSRLYMASGLLTLKYYNITGVSGTCGMKRNIKIHFLCPTSNQELGPHVTFLDHDLCLTIVTWYTSFACGQAAIQASGCVLSTPGGFTFDLTSLSTPVIQAQNSSSSYNYSLQICSGNSLYLGCSPHPPVDTRVIQEDSHGRCFSLGRGSGHLRYADGTLTLTYSQGETCHSNFARTSFITFLCPENLDREHANTSTVRFLGEEDCFYEFEWVTPLACGSKTSGVSDCQFELHSGGTYNFAPLVGTEGLNWVAIASDADIACFMINPCGELTVNKDRHTSGRDYCNERRAPYSCSGVSVCKIFTNGSATPIGKFDLRDNAMITSVDNNVFTIMGGNENNNDTAVIHYVCKTGDLFSAPVYVGLSNENFYEFHWTTFAACPSGVQSGSDCTVSYQGFLFNLSSIPMLRFDSGNYTYEIAVCSSLQSNMTNCTDGDSRNAAVCQVENRGSQRHFKLGQVNSTLLYVDGSLKLNYTHGQACKTKSKSPRVTTILFICDSTAHNASVSSVTEDRCDYVVEVRTKLACPPANRATECIFLNKTNSYDFSDLSRSLNQGNWETRSPDGSVYYINICQPLNRLPGCSPLAGICKKESHDGHVTYTNLGVAYNANFSSVHRDGKDLITLRYQYPTRSSCPSVQATIEFICNKSKQGSEVGPVYASGGTSQNPCEYRFLWETVRACPIHMYKSHSCQLTIPSVYTFDLLPLQLNHSQPYQAANQTLQHSFDLAICGSLPPVKCANKSGVTVCQTDSHGHKHACGLNTTQELHYFDGALYMEYSGGDTCSNNKNRSVRINFECDRTASMSNGPHYLAESACAYSFEWPTPLACLPQELECVAAGGKYDLTPLLGQHNWEVDTAAVGGAFKYVIGGCRSLNINQLPHCPLVPWMGACRFPSTSHSRNGMALGYMTGDIVEESEGELRLEYHNGDVCHGGKKSMVYIHFICEPRSGRGVPKLAPNSDNCYTHINWVTQYACSRIFTSSDWVIRDNVTSSVFNLTSLPNSLSVNQSSGSDTYTYTISLHGVPVPCTGSSNQTGACQTKITGDCATNPATTQGCIHSLGNVNRTLTMTDTKIRTEYQNGDKCRNHAERISFISFACDHGEKPFLQVLPENHCEYTFVVYTHLVCANTVNPGVECQVSGFGDLVAFQRMPAHTVMAEGQPVHLSVCETLGPGVQNCLPSSAACLISRNGPVNIGAPDVHFPLKPMANKTGVIVHYIGSTCNKTSGAKWNTTLLLICNRNVQVGVPQFVGRVECQYTFRWESMSACPTFLPSSNSSNSSCSLVDPYTNDQVLNFKPFIKNLNLTVSDTRGGHYYIQLCGTAVSQSLPSDCDSSVTGICHEHADGHAHPMVYANHTFILVSHSPRIIEVVFHSGIQCENRNWTAVVRMICSNQAEHPVPEFVSNVHCELNFVWRNQSFCAGESAAAGCSAVDKTDNYVYSLDGLLLQNWTGLVSKSPGGPGTTDSGVFSLGICRNLNPFTSSGLNCSSPSAVCWHAPNNTHINLGRSSSPPELTNSSIHIEYTHGDICNATSGQRFHTDLYIHCATDPSAPVLSESLAQKNNCSWIIAMDSPLACRHQLSSNSCMIDTAAGRFNFSDIASTPIMLNDQYSVCLCGNVSVSCKYSGLVKINGSSEPISLGKFRNLTISSSTGGPQFSYYGGSNCYATGNTHYQSWLFMECDRTATTQDRFTSLESASSKCVKVFIWYTSRACLSEQVSCSSRVSSSGGEFYFDFSLLHAHNRPWKAKGTGEVYYINVCGPIVNHYAYGISSCGGDVSICVKPSDGTRPYAIATASTQHIYYDGKNVVMKFTGPPISRCRGRSPRVTITMICALGGLSFISKSGECAYDFKWQTPYACTAKPRVFSKCAESMSVASETGYVIFKPLEIAQSKGYNYHGPEGQYSVNICGTSNCPEKNASVCFHGGPVIATNTSQSIMLDGYQMLVQMDGPKNRHAIIKVECVFPDQQFTNLSSHVILDNVIQNGKRKFYYFTLYVKEGHGCQFVSSTEAPSNTASSNPGGGGKGAVSKGGQSGAAIAAIVVTLVVVALVLVAIFYKKSRRERVRKAFVYLRVGRSSEAVRYHKVSTKEEEQSLMGDNSDSEGNEEETSLDGGEQDQRNDKKDENSDEELINL